jgi:DNA topoisomerase-3
MGILVVAEKPSVAMSISKILGANSKKDGYTDGNGYIVSWCIGHLVGLSEPEEYGERYAEKPWKTEDLPILPETWKFSVNSGTKKQFDVLKKLMNDKNITEIVCATDAGREGECIFRYVYNAAKCRKKVKRLWISSLEESAIKSGFGSLKDGKDFDRLYESGLCRAKADWLVGMNGTRLFSAVYRNFLSIGRVQTPTLAMIAERDFKVKNFVKEKYFTAEIDCGDFIASSERIDSLAVAEKVKNDCDGQTAKAANLKKEMKNINPPKLFDLTSLQREANRLFSFSAQRTLDITQSLYEKKLVTDPRTDSQFLTEDMEQTALKTVRIAIGKIPLYKHFTLPDPDLKNAVNNKKVSDHHAIIPTAELENYDLDTLSDDERKILFMIANKLICAAGKTHKYEASVVEIQCGCHLFKASGKTVAELGWKEAEQLFRNEQKVKNDGEKEEKSQSLPADLAVGNVFENCACTVAEHFTSPPKYYTEDTLLSAMETAGNADYTEDSDVEKKGIGTPATRANIIETLIKRGYAERKKKLILATEKGINLIQIVPAEIKSAKLTADWETRLRKIEKGEVNSDDFMREISEFVNKFVAENSVSAQEYADSFCPEKEVNIIGKCPKCGKKVTETPKAYSCSGGRGGCGFVVWKIIASKTIPEKQVRKLLYKKKSDKIKGFKSKTGKEFEAFLVIKDDFKVGFEF